MICSPWLICFLIFVSPRFSWTMRSCHWQNLWISVSRMWPHPPPSSPQHWLRSAGNSKKITTIHHEKTLSTNIAPSISVTQFSLTNINLYNSPPSCPEEWLKMEVSVLSSGDGQIFHRSVERWKFYYLESFEIENWKMKKVLSSGDGQIFHRSVERWKFYYLESFEIENWKMKKVLSSGDGQIFHRSVES